jgi:hypothetical protein
MKIPHPTWLGNSNQMVIIHLSETNSFEVSVILLVFAGLILAIYSFCIIIFGPVKEKCKLKVRTNAIQALFCCILITSSAWFWCPANAFRAACWFTIYIKISSSYLTCYPLKAHWKELTSIGIQNPTPKTIMAHYPND